MRNKIIVALVALAAIAGISMYALAPKQESIEYRLGAVETGDIESLVVSTGTLEALNTVIVGSQLSGQIDELRADFNDVVEEGQIIARIDPRTFEARKAQNSADVEVARANIVSRKAELTRATANLRQARRELSRRHSLKERGHVSESQLDADITAVETAAALVEVAEASVTNAEAALAQREAALAQSELDLERTLIRSPVDGTVINRTIELGQTVAASFSAPELFAIGQDLHQMKVEASIDEADIGRVREGMQCRFTVDAYPERRFRGRIQQIRKAPNVLQNVVTYKVIITANNADLALLPGMTANVEIVLGRKDEVLRIPNGALRFAPRTAGDTPAAPQRPSGRPGLVGGFGPPRGGQQAGGGRGQRQSPVALVREQFDLTEEQETALAAIESEQRERMRSAFQAASGDRASMQAQMQGMRQQMQEAIAAVLTEEQNAKLAELRTGRSGQRRATVYVLGGDGNPEPRRIVTGLADDEHTEVMSGLEDGDQVILRAVRTRS